MTTAPLDRSAYDLAARQHGVLARRQLTDLGCSTGWVRTRLRHGVLERVTARVLRVSGSAPSKEQGMLVGVLHAPPPAVVSHRSAAELWGLPGFATSTVHITAGGRGHAVDDVDALLVHRPRRLRPRHTMVLRDVPVTTPARTIFDLAGAPDVHPLRVARALDTAMAKNLVTPGSLEQMLADLGGRGRPGITLMRALCEERCDADWVPPESNLESRFADLTVGAGLGRLVRQVDVGTEHDWVTRADFRHPELPLLVEIDSTTYHSSLSDRRRDEARRAALQAAGWWVLAFTDHDLFHRPDDVVARLRHADRTLRASA